MKNIFHIGYHKTATTWFQKIFYISVQNFKVVNREKIRNYFYENINEEFNSNNDLIFCDEELSGNIHNSGYSGFLTNGIARKISEFENPKVIIFIRNQFDIIPSSYLQYVKEGGNYSLKRYIKHEEFSRNNRTSLFSYSHFNYENVISYYVSLIGRENVYVYLFEDFISNQKEFIDKFTETHQFQIDKKSIDFSKNNNSYSYISLFLARIINSFSRKNVIYKYYILHIPYVYEYAREILRRVKFFPIKNKSFLGGELRNEIQSYYSESNKRISNKYNLDLEKYNYPI